jgi:phosphoglycerate-specific signal transduction histidine kinase
MNARSDSLFRKLQEAKDPSGKPLNRLNDLMIFLEDTPIDMDDAVELKVVGLNPSKIRKDRFQKGADLVNSWGIKCGRSAIWSLYKSYVLYWRIAVANGAAQTTEELSSFEEKIKKLSAQRTFEALADPELSPKILTGLAKIEFQKEALLHDKEKLKAALRTKLETAMEALKQELGNNPAAFEAFKQMQAALAPKKK